MTMFSEKKSKFLIYLGFLLIILGIFLFLYRSELSISKELDSSKVGQFGDFIGGVVGAVWSLAGVILFYIALQDQKKDIEINRQALQQQIEEFKLQREELEATRKVFSEQSDILKIQRFENTFFQLLNLHHEIIGNLNLHINGKDYDKREVFSFCKKNLANTFNSYTDIYDNDGYGGYLKIGEKPTDTDLQVEELVSECYISFYYYDTNQVLSHYFRSVYHVFKFIFKSSLLSKEDKQFYASLFRSQLSSDELFVILYNSLHEDLGYPKFLFLIKEFDILQNFDFSLVEKYKFHKELYERKIKSLEGMEVL